MSTKMNDVTFGVNTVGNIQALTMCLSSVLMGTYIPARIQIRLEGKLPDFANFYLEQMAELARVKGVDFLMCVANSQGVRVARDWQLDNCGTYYLWMGDDDAIYTPMCLEYFSQGVNAIQRDNDWVKTAYLCGSKSDLNNRRGYKDFNTEMHGPEDLKENAAYNFFWHPGECAGKYARIQTADTGNMFLQVPVVREKNIRFQIWQDSLNSGGEDTLFGLRCRKAKLDAWFVPSAVAYHLEKPQVNFNEFAARGEMVLRAADLLGLDKEHLHECFMPWLFSKQQTGFNVKS